MIIPIFRLAIFGAIRGFLTPGATTKGKLLFLSTTKAADEPVVVMILVIAYVGVPAAAQHLVGSPSIFRFFLLLFLGFGGFRSNAERKRIEMIQGSGRRWS